MRLTLDDILSAHGIGGGLAPYFGDGSDGAFAPASAPGNTTVQATIAPDAKTYSNTSGGSLAASSGVTTLNWDMAVLLSVCGANGYNASSDVDLNTPTTTASTGNSSGYYGPKFTVAQTTKIDGAAIYTNQAGNTATITIWDSNANVIATANTTSVTGWTRVTFSPVTLNAGMTYFIGINGAGSYLYSNSSVTTRTISATVNLVSTVTFTAPAQDGGPVIKNFTSINIPANVTVTVDKRCKGLILLCKGDVTINGTISMDYMAALADPTNQSNNPPYAVVDKLQYLYKPTQDSKTKVIVIGVGGNGGSGGSGGSSTTGGFTGAFSEPNNGGIGSNGTWWGGGSGGGGGGGFASFSQASYYGNGGKGGNGGFVSNGTGGSSVSVSPGAGANASSSGHDGTTNSGGSGAVAALNNGNGTATATSGAGGSSNSAGGSGGGGGAACGNGSTSGTQTASGGAGYSAPSGQGAGGLILIIAKGNVTINSGAVLTAKGTNGGNGGQGGANDGGYGSVYSVGCGGGGGGGAGGGIISILYKGTFTNSGTTNVSGGTGGTGGNSAMGNTTNKSNMTHGQNGQNGQNGIVQTVQL